MTEDAARERWQDLPERVDPADTVESVPVTDAPDPDGGHDPNHEWMIRHG
jgi:hypothetical protein